MKIGKTELIAQTREISFTCDLCGCKIRESISSRGFVLGGTFNWFTDKISEWREDKYIDDFVLYQADICKNCFFDKIKPAVEKLGVKFHTDRNYGEYDEYEEEIMATRKEK